MTPHRPQCSRTPWQKLGKRLRGKVHYSVHFNNFSPAAHLPNSLQWIGQSSHLLRFLSSRAEDINTIQGTHSLYFWRQLRQILTKLLIHITMQTNNKASSQWLRTVSSWRMFARAPPVKAKKNQQKWKHLQLVGTEFSWNIHTHLYGSSHGSLRFNKYIFCRRKALVVSRTVPEVYVLIGLSAVLSRYTYICSFLRFSAIVVVEPQLEPHNW